MRIAYYNPWLDSAENQSFASLAIAAQTLGVTVHACASHGQIEACDPDFVLSISSSFPKMVDIPSYLTVHAPPGVYLESPGELKNLLSYDGFVTISDSIDRFLRDIMFGVGRQERPGFYYNTPQLTHLRTDWTAGALQDLQVVYLGSNWDRRHLDLFRLLDRAEIIRIFGPEVAWKQEGYGAYRGPLPFDGLAPQRAYARHGVGLALLADRWWQEDVISNRIFEIVSVGAVAICPDMPWTRKWFGNSVLYFDPTDTDANIAKQVAKRHEFCCAHPKDAQHMGEAAREVFEKHFACDRLLPHLLDYHEEKTGSRRRRRASVVQHPEIGVIVRCGGRPISSVKRAVDSIRAQHLGEFAVILVKYSDIDLSSITSDPSGAVREFIEVPVPGGGRAETLFEGIRHVTSPYFAVLDDDDFWLSDHIEELFRAGRLAGGADFDIAFSGSVAFDYPVFYRENQFCDRNITHFGLSSEPADVLEVVETIAMNSFVARRDLLTDQVLEAPLMNTAEDSLLIALLARRSRPAFSYRATAFYRRSASDGSRWESDPSRPRDELSLALRTGLARQPRWLQRASFEIPIRKWKEIGLPALPGRKREDSVPLEVAIGTGAHIRDLEMQVSESTADIRDLEMQVSESTAYTRDLEMQVSQGTARMHDLDMQVSALLNSTSWRVTLPLRMLGQLLRRLTPGRGAG